MKNFYKSFMAIRLRKFRRSIIRKRGFPPRIVYDLMEDPRAIMQLVVDAISDV